jgi:hypothetical protein
MSSNTTVQFQLKLAYTHHVRVYTFSLDTTIASLIEIIQKNAFSDFDPFIERTLFNQVEVVESGQYNNINGFNPELAPALEPSEITIREKYEGRYNQTAFYIRCLQI